MKAGLLHFSLLAGKAVKSKLRLLLEQPSYLRWVEIMKGLLEISFGSLIPSTRQKSGANVQRQTVSETKLGEEGFILYCQNGRIGGKREEFSK